MSLSNAEREQIKLDILKQVDLRALDVNGIANKHLISRQTVYRYVRELQKQQIIEKNDENKYALVSQIQQKSYENTSLIEEIVWRKDISPFFQGIPQKALDKAKYIFLEIMNNAIEHSDATNIDVILKKTQIDLAIYISDNGIGIFRKIQSALDLQEKGFAILELSKGKLTTDPDKHTGEGIFFSSRIADAFYIFSDELTFISKQSNETRDTMYVGKQSLPCGTAVAAHIYFDNNTSISNVFHMFTEHPEHIGFNATHVPVRLLEYGSENPIFVSRSEARRLLSRFERFNRIILDFAGVEDIRQGFADEVFRVFPRAHPDCKIEAVNCNENVQTMIAHVKNTK
jgi:anti-sigma regulatory factor (Ser/Thr protein kinase)